MRSGALRCSDCHPIHGGATGVAFGGSAPTWFGPNAEPPAEASARVPVVPIAVCARCHDPAAAGDPVRRCEDASGVFSLCFDEHQRVHGDALEPRLRDRLAYWAKARAAVEGRGDDAGRPVPGLLWGVVAASAFVVLVARHGLNRPARAASAAPDVAPPKRHRLPQIDANTCLGCSACVDACPYDVLTLDRFVARVARPQDCCGLTTCEERCPNGSLVVRTGEPIADRPAVQDSLESTDVPGLYLAGDLTGMPLIRNAINQGAVAVDHIAAGPRRGRGEALDVLVVGAGPAGLAAALSAKKHGLRSVVVEQGDLAQSIQSFPRGKLVFDQPLSVPLVGALWLAESTKEELLRQWTRIVRTERLPLRTHHRVTDITAEEHGFSVRCDGREAPFRAANVVLAIGRRGTPRRLDVPVAPAMVSSVHYSLADARSFAHRACVVVGLGDVAMEAALGLSYVPGTRVTVLARGTDFRRGKSRNIEAMRTAEAAGRLEIRWGTEVAEVREGEVVLADGQGVLAADAVFVMVGSIAPWAFLDRVGVRRAGAAEVFD